MNSTLQGYFMRQKTINSNEHYKYIRAKKVIRLSTFLCLVYLRYHTASELNFFKFSPYTNCFLMTFKLKLKRIIIKTIIKKYFFK